MLIVFRAGELRLAIDARHVQEVSRVLPLSAPLPNSRGVAGMVTFRGSPTAVIDLNIALNVPCGQRDRCARMIAVRHRGSTVCLLVDQIDGLQNVTAADLERPPSVIADLHGGCLDYVTRSEAGELVGVIDVDRVLSQAGPAGIEVDGSSA